jgi:hypothetical protein
MYFSELLSQWKVAGQTPNIPECCSFCMEIVCPETTQLQVETINEIVIPVEDDRPIQFLLHVQSHLSDKPWRVVSEFLTVSSTLHSISIPIVASSPHTLQKGDPICHFILALPHHAFQLLKGNTFFSTLISLP